MGLGSVGVTKMIEFTEEERHAFIKRWVEETSTELLSRDAPYSKPCRVKLGVRAGRRGIIAGMKWAENNRSFYQVESMTKSYPGILPLEDEALFDDDDRAELLASTWDKDGDITYGWGWQAGVEAVHNKWMGKK
jgi:hypothetical protein